jgi:dinuclear metal center YbgI/SA1388 family protein
LDCTVAVVEEALQRGVNMIVAHHPIVFSGMKKFSGNDYVSQVIRLAIKNDLAIFALHTNLDNIQQGVNAKIAAQLGLQQTRILAPMSHQLCKLFTFVPQSHHKEVLQALFDAGAGNIGNYAECSFGVTGTGTFKPLDSAQPCVGKLQERHNESEVRIEVVLPVHAQEAVVKALLAAHPYEEVAYDLILLQNQWQQAGAGLIGTLPEPMETMAFLTHLKNQMQTACVRYTQPVQATVQKIAVCGGSGSFLLKNALAAQADVFVTADFKYHEFFDANGKIVIADIGHFESEQFTIPLIAAFLKEKFPTFATLLTKSNTNPVNYL